MTILGIDPGLERVGYGLIHKKGSKLTAIDYGLISTPRIQTSDRLLLIHEQINELFQKAQPDVVAIEKLIFAANKTTAFDVAMALGVIQLATAQKGLKCHQYAPNEIKLAVVGQGRAEKKQVQYMVTRLLSLKETPKPDDVADALAIAICHSLRCGLSAKAFG